MNVESVFRQGVAFATELLVELEATGAVHLAAAIKKVARIDLKDKRF